MYVRLDCSTKSWFGCISPPNADSHKRCRLQVPPCSLPGNPTDFKALPGNRPNWLLASFCKTPDWTSSSGFIKSSSKKSPQIPLLWTRSFRTFQAPISCFRSFRPSGFPQNPKKSWKYSLLWWIFYFAQKQQIFLLSLSSSSWLCCSCSCWSPSTWSWRYFSSRHDVLLQARANERPGVLHISWAGEWTSNKN